MLVETEAGTEDKFFAETLKPRGLESVGDGAEGIAVVTVTGLEGAAERGKGAVEGREGDPLVAFAGAIFTEGLAEKNTG